MSIKNAIGGIALIAGTAIGAAVLALPVSTAHLGFIQTIILYGVCWSFMTLGALYLLEANLFIGHGTNLITMANRTLGKGGQYATWGAYLILLYALCTAYLAGAGAWIHSVSTHFQLGLPPYSATLFATGLTMTVIFLGTAVTDWVNRFLMLGLIGAFVTLLVLILKHVSHDTLLATSSMIDLRPIPLMITGFGFAIVIPSLTAYLHGKPRDLFWVVLLGSSVPLLVYVFWEYAILGTIPLEGDLGLLQIQQQGHPVTDVPKALGALLQTKIVPQACAYFSIFALITSLLGVTLSLFDFLADGLHLRKNSQGKALLSLITFIPPLVFALTYPRGFTFALSFAGLFVAFLLGILPAMMVWQGRYRLKIAQSYRVPGGKIVISLTGLFFLLVIIIECYNQYYAFTH